MIIQCDTRQKRKHHEAKEAYFRAQGYELINSKMAVGDYQVMSDGSVVVDTKADCSELYGNLISDHDRFRRECELAQKANIQLYVLVENKDGITVPREIVKWENPQWARYKLAVKKAQKDGVKPPRPPAGNMALLKTMRTMHERYGVDFKFCAPEEAGAKVLELLGAENDKGNGNQDSQEVC